MIIGWFNIFVNKNNKKIIEAVIPHIFLNLKSFAMKNLHLTKIIIFVLLVTTLTGCEVIGGIFEAGVWVGVIIVILVIALIIWLIRKMIS